MADGNGTLTPRQRALVAALASGKSGRDAARAIGMSERQFWRHMENPLVRAALVAAQDEALGDVVRQMNAGAADALEVLREVMADKRQPAGVRVRAAAIWLEQGFRAREMLDLATRLTVLEEAIGNDRPHR